MKAYVFPGQGSQFTGMGKSLYDGNARARELFERANEILGFNITDVMFSGTAEELKATRVTQPAIFVHSVLLASCLKDGDVINGYEGGFNPDMVAGHSLGEFSALTAAGALSFEDGLRLVAIRASAMQKACEIKPSTMAAILGLDSSKIEDICKEETDGVVVPANYNCDGQVVISGDIEAVTLDDDIKEKVTPELFTLHICMNMVGNWQCDGWWYIICEQVQLVPFIPEALNALGLSALKTAFEKVISCFPQDTTFTDDNNYIDTVNFLQNDRFKVSNPKLNAISIEKRKGMVKKTRHCIEELEQLTEPLWGHAGENNGWKTVLDYISAHK